MVRTVGLLAAGQPRDTRAFGQSEHTVARLEAALQAVLNPDTYLHGGHGLPPSHRAALAERAKAVTGLLLFEIEGLIRARARFREKGICDVPSVVHNAWLRWLQLHARQAEVVVPMDGWLASAFPKSLLTSDQLVLDALARSTALGLTEQASPDIVLPAEMLIPADMFGELLQEPDLASQVARLLSRQTLLLGDLASRATGSGNLGPTAKLVQDFASMLVTTEPSTGDYPPH